MLREIQAVRQDKPGLQRRWYEDEFFDLYTWHSPDGALVSFQVCYDVRDRERVLSWHRQHGFSHARIDSGEEAAGFPMTPMLIAGGRFPHRLVRERFSRHAGCLDAATRDFILDKMREYGRLIARGFAPLPRGKRRNPDAAGPS